MASGILSALAYGGSQGLMSSLGGIARDYFAKKGIVDAEMKKTILEQLINAGQTGGPAIAAKVGPKIEELTGIKLPTTELETKPATYQGRGFTPAEGVDISTLAGATPAETTQVPILGSPLKLEAMLSSVLARDQGLSKQAAIAKFLAPAALGERKLDLAELIGGRRYGAGGLEEQLLGIKGLGAQARLATAAAAQGRLGLAQEKAPYEIGKIQAQTEYLKQQGLTMPEKAKLLREQGNYWRQQALDVAGLNDAKIGKLEADAEKTYVEIQNLPLTAQTKALHESILSVREGIMNGALSSREQRPVIADALGTIQSQLAAIHEAAGKTEAPAGRPGKRSGAGGGSSSANDFNAAAEEARRRGLLR